MNQSHGVEFVYVANFFAQFEHEDGKKGSEPFLYKQLPNTNVTDTFPNVEIMLRMNLVLMVTKYSGE